jgi:hypothetical protein
MRASQLYKGEQIRNKLSDTASATKKLSSDAIRDVIRAMTTMVMVFPNRPMITATIIKTC